MFWPFKKRTKEREAEDARWAAREARLLEMWPDINDPSSPRYYAARRTGNEWRALIKATRRSAQP